MRVPFERVLQEIASWSFVTVFPMDIYTVSHLSSKLDIHDSVIVATALQCREYFAEDVALLTNDIAITQSGLIPVIW